MKKTFKWIGIVVGALFLLGFVGSMISPDPTTSPEYAQVIEERDQAKTDLATAEAKVESAEAEVETAEAEIRTIAGDLPDREKAVTKAKNAVKQRETKVAAAEKAVKAAEKAVGRREKAVGLVEDEIEANTITDGLYEVGSDVKAGTYKTDGASNCYYSVLGSADTSDILNNSLGNGPSIATVSDGQFLELSCSGAEWVLQH